MADDSGRPTEWPTTTAAAGATAPGSRIGPYRVCQRIGEGGMGDVFLAEQERPVARRVALKLIKPGMDSRHVLARFEAERQALALMDHPCIARVYEAGMTEQGRPYFAMEYVQGVPITTYCDTHRLDTGARLELFIRVCEGVQHAHHKGVIHRDVKPSNVLVRIEDDRPVPKIIDFGVAKAIGPRLTERTMHTQIGVPIGTPEFMSPEQAEMTGLDIDTRTDVYALGVLLYVLLVGALPFDSGELRGVSLDEIRRRIREDEPSKPSTRLTTLHDARGEAALRRSDPGALRRQLSGDLDWITMKALAKDRTQRYGSPTELAADIRRHLRHEPVLAGPPSAAYRLGKFARRHRIAVGAAAVVLAALLLGISGTSYGLLRARQAETAARHQAETAAEVAHFLERVFTASDPYEEPSPSLSAGELLERGAAMVDDELAGRPLVRAELMQTIGRISRRRGMFDRSAALLAAALAAREALLGPEHQDTLRAASELAATRARQARFAEAESLARRTLEAQVRTLGGDHPDALETRLLLADALRAQDRLAEAEPLVRGALDALRRIHGPDHPDTLGAVNRLANLLWNEREFSASESLYRQALAGRRRALGEDHPETLETQHDLAVLLENVERWDEAERLHRQALGLLRARLGPDHPRTLRSMLNLAVLYRRTGRYDEAETLYRHVLDSRSRDLGEDHPDTARAMANLALLYASLGRYDEAEPLYLRSLAVQRARLGESHSETTNTLYNLACLAALRGRLDEALRRLREAVGGGWARAGIFDDPDLDPLRGTPEFEALLTQVRQRL